MITVVFGHYNCLLFLIDFRCVYHEATPYIAGLKSKPLTWHYNQLYQNDQHFNIRCKIICLLQTVRNSGFLFTNSWLKWLYPDLALHPLITFSLTLCRSLGHSQGRCLEASYPWLICKCLHQNQSSHTRQGHYIKIASYTSITQAWKCCCFNHRCVYYDM